MSVWKDVLSPLKPHDKGVSLESHWAQTGKKLTGNMNPVNRPIGNSR